MEHKRGSQAGLQRAAEGEGEQAVKGVNMEQNRGHTGAECTGGAVSASLQRPLVLIDGRSNRI